MSDSRKPSNADNEEAIRKANELDVEFNKAVGDLNAAVADIASFDESVRAATPQPSSTSEWYITKDEYESLNKVGLGGFFKSFTGPKVSVDDQKEINFNKTVLQGCGTDQERYQKAVEQRDDINKTPGVSGALRQYANKLDNLIQVAISRALTAQHAPQKKS